MFHAIVSREEWLTARKALFDKEREITHALDALRAERRALPWVRIDQPYVFEGPQGSCTLGDLFGDRSQLAVYHFMLTPGSDHICPGCSFTMDHADAARQHFEQADLAFAAVSRAPVAQIEAAKKRLGWTFPWVSSGRTAASPMISACRSRPRTARPGGRSTITAICTSSAAPTCSG
ncbi:DUF899 family protein [Rhizorhabdus histidinilytica]